MDFRRNTHHLEPDINLIPLIDVVLVIIIFLMLTTTFSKISGLEINLPTAEAPEQAETQPNEIVVAITAAGDVLVNGLPVGSHEVEAIAAALGKATPQGKEPVVIVNADAKTAHQRVIDVMQAAQRTGLAHITFAIQSQGE
ncbi:ExbD/TolR family protein [Pseudothauera rhizosphaerae]|uniref:Biopolymer transporter ExbD n=1 Tax=Pseudothauera rhizosphaerae TaxID=2565932 RepID=A0A4S4AY25_9RHOO|nr:biopolymer transporter ExbD [Pseudothauera rhizosphaerae]THF63512.1 biopolymer transporter ExbD [Pseudothauera rhizosphaerae]